MRYPLLLLSLCFNILILSPSAIAGASADASCYSDYIDPVAVCDAHTVVALGSNGVATVYAETFDDGSYDNCHISHFKARRMWEGWCPYGVVDDTQFRPYVQFCCEDVGAGPIWIVMRVFDEHGNFNECMVEVTVQEGPGGNLHCPPDKWVDCEYWFDWNDLYDPWNTYFGWASGSGGCNNPDIHVEVHDHRNQCGTGYIKRIFSTGGGGYGYGYGDQCIQHIHFKNNHPFNGNSIHWPPHYEASGCEYHNIDPHYLPHPYGKPTWYDASCSMIGYSYDDQVFEFVDGVCKKVLRKWTIIDWCKFDPHHPYYGGIWTYTQILKLVDHGKPWIENCHDVIVDGEEAHCKGRFHHDPSAWDDCTPPDKLKYEYKIDIYANGSIDIIKKGHRYIDELLPSGTHKVYWFIDDGCGNLSSCHFYVTIKDKKPPTPICFAQLSTVVMPLGGMVTLWARDFDASSFDNCTPAHLLKFSFSPDVLEGSRTFTCDDVGVVPLKVYVTDQAGNKAYCNVTVTITDNGPICPDINPLTGSVEMFTGEAISDAEVALYKVMPNNIMLMDMMRMSDNNGDYRVGFGTTQYDRMLDVTKQGDPMLGISTLDLVYLQQHVLGINKLTHPAALLAADVDGSGRVGVNDLLMLRDAFISDGKSLQGAALPWNFYPKSCAWEADGTTDCEFEIEINHIVVPSGPFDFVGYKLGDINGDVMVNPGNRAGYKYPVGVRYNKENREFEFIALDNASILGMQVSLRSAALGVPGSLTGGELNVTSQSCFVDFDDEVVNMAWVTPNAQTISKGQVLFTMPVPEFQALRSGSVSWKKGQFRNEIYLPDRTPVAVDIRSLDEQLDPDSDDVVGISGEGVQTVQDLGLRSAGSVEIEAFFAPNPMIEAGLLYFRLAESQEVTLEIYTANQQVIDSRKIAGARGMNEVLIKAGDLGLPGVYLYRLTVGEETLTGRIVSVN